MQSRCRSLSGVLPRCAPCLAVAVLGLSCAVSHAGVAITGNPSIDSGWSAAGNSLDNGVYIRGSGGFGYQVYTTSFVIEAGSPLIASGWTIGETVLAMGGIMESTTYVDAGWASAFGGSGSVNGANFTTSIRIVAKFGTSTSDFTPSTIKPYITSGSTSNGDGQGSLEGGYGGEGAILLGTAVGDLPASGAGTLVPMTQNLRYTNNGATSTSLSSNDAGRLIYRVDGSTSKLSSWEVLLNTTRLSALLPLGAAIPVAGDQVNQALQRSTNAYQFNDALASTPLMAAEVPEPSSFAIALLWLGGLGMVRAARFGWKRAR